VPEALEADVLRLVIVRGSRTLERLERATLLRAEEGAGMLVEPLEERLTSAWMPQGVSASRSQYAQQP